MSETKAKKVAPRWKKGGERYGKQDQSALKKIRPTDGWRNGARVVKR